MRPRIRFIATCSLLSIALIGCHNGQTPATDAGTGDARTGDAGASPVLDGSTDLSASPRDAALDGSSAYDLSSPIDAAPPVDAGAPDQGMVSDCDASLPPGALANFAAAETYSNAHGGDALLVKHCGETVYESYVPPISATITHMLASGTKSFSCALFALGAANGLWTLDEVVSDTITEWRGDPLKSQIRVEHLLSLTSGLRDSSDYNPALVGALDTYSLSINGSTIEYAPGEACIYAASNFQVLAALFERKTNGLDPVRYLYDHLLAKLGYSIDRVDRWTRDLRSNPQMAGGAHLTAREWANYGHLMLRYGRWGSEQLLDEDTVRLCSTYSNQAFLGYGLTWWLNRPTNGTYDDVVDGIPQDAIGDGDQIANTAPEDMYMAAGSGRQRLYVIPSLDLVVVRYGRAIDNDTWTDHDFLGTLLGTGN